MAAIIIATWIVGYVASETPGGPDSPKRLLVNIHKSVAITVLALVVVRLAWRILHAPPPLTLGSALARFAAHAGHWLLYFLMIAMPLTGWAWASSSSRPVEFLGLFELPPLLAPNDAAKSLLGEMHRTLAWVTAVVIVGHVLAALKHWLLDKDDVLRSMLSRRS